MENKYAAIAAKLEARKAELSEAEQQILALSKLTYTKIDRAIDDMKSLADAKVLLQILGKALLATIKVLRKQQIIIKEEQDGEN